MRKIWVQIDPWNKNLATTAIESGADGILLPNESADKVRELGKITTIAKDGDLILNEDVVFFTIKSHEDEPELVKLCREKRVVLQCDDWQIIPLENLIAQDADIIAQVRDAQEVETAFGVLERGVAHVLLTSSDMVEVKKVLTALKAGNQKTALTTATIVSVEPLSMGDRVCVDTCTTMIPGQGLLVGNSSGVLFLVHAESLENPYVAARPFRVNAGPVHAYTRVGDGKTRYLSELSAGDSVLIVDYEGNTESAIIGRLKIEKRPLMLVKAQMDGQIASTIVQNAETIRLTRPGGEAVSVVKLAPGDEVLCAVEKTGRHFGHAIEETITEK